MDSQEALRRAAELHAHKRAAMDPREVEQRRELARLEPRLTAKVTAWVGRLLERTRAG